MKNAIPLGGDKMRAKQYLESYRRKEIEIRKHKARIKELEDTRDCVSAIKLSDVPASHSVSDKTSDIAIKISDAQRELRGKVEEALMMQAEILSVLEQIKDGREYDLLYSRYIEAKSWREVGDGLCYAHAQIYRIHVRALRHFEEAMTGDQSSPVVTNGTDNDNDNDNDNDKDNERDSFS